VTERRAIGLWTAAALVVGNIVGSGVYLLPASLAPYGGLALGGWLISAGGTLLLALVFARLARRSPQAGGIYAYSRDAFGEFGGFLVGWGYWISCWSGCAALGVAFAGYLAVFVPAVAASPVLAAVVAIAALWLFVGVNVSGVREAGLVQAVTTVIKMLPLVLVAIAGLVWFAPSHFSIPPPYAGASVGATLGTLFAIASLTMWALLGTEVATIPADAVDNPDRTIPRATIFGAVVAILVTMLGTIGITSLVDPAVLRTTTAPFADAVQPIFGDRAREIVAIGAAISVLGAMNGWILIMGQFPMAVAKDGLLPPIFARTGARGTPAPALIIGGALATILIAANYSRSLVSLFTFVIQLATLSTLVPYAFCALADWRHHRRSVVSIGAFVFAVIAIAGVGPDVVYWGFLLLIGGLPVYSWLRRMA